MRLLLDTTYIMPLAGIETDRFGREDFSELYSMEDVELLVSPVSLIEVKWIIIGSTKGQPALREKLRRRYRDMLNLLLHSNVIGLTPLLDENINREEDRLLDLGINDYFDRIIFSTAVHYADALLTEDKSLHSIWRNSRAYKYFITLYTWRDFKALHLHGDSG